MSNYWLGFFTLPVITLAGFALLVAWLRTYDWLGRRGYTVEIKRRRGSQIKAPRTREGDDWAERAIGPIFYGHWRSERNGRHHINRWIAVGRVTGPCAMFFKLRVR